MIRKSLLSAFLLKLSLLGLLMIVMTCQTIENSQKEPIKNNQALESVNLYNRRQFWFYLRKADLIYTHSEVLPDKYSFLFLYSNFLGVFLSISSYEIKKNAITIQSFVRLGNIIKEIMNDEEKELINLNPLIIELRIADKNYQVQVDQNGIIKVDADIFQLHNGPQSYQDNRILLLDIYIKHRYWHYLQGAQIAMTQTIRANNSTYTFFIYEHFSGIYLVISRLTNSYQLEVNTFVRIGGMIKLPQQENSGKLMSQIDPRIFVLS